MVEVGVIVLWYSFIVGVGIIGIIVELVGVNCGVIRFVAVCIIGVVCIVIIPTITCVGSGIISNCIVICGIVSWSKVTVVGVGIVVISIHALNTFTLISYLFVAN